MVSLSTAGTRKRKQPATEENKVGLRGTRKVRAGLALHARRVRYPEGDAERVKEGTEQIKSARLEGDTAFVIDSLE